MHDPIVIDPPGFDPKAAWKECQEYAGRMLAAHRPHAAAAGADPGVCSCPACREMHWAWGRRQRCTKCGFEYPTDWWPMYAWGVAAGLRTSNRFKHEERLAHPYYRYGFEHPVEDAWREIEKIDWRSAMATPA